MVREWDWECFQPTNPHVAQPVSPPLCDLNCDLPRKALAPIGVAYEADFALRKSLIVFDAKGGCEGQ
jgi:hypothetical protein